MAFDPALLALFAELRGGSLITLRRDGRPQASVVIHVWDPGRRAVRISVTDDRAKTRNLRRDPRASYHVVAPDLSSWAVGEGFAELTPPAAYLGQSYFAKWCINLLVQAIDKGTFTLEEALSGATHRTAPKAPPRGMDAVLARLRASCAAVGCEARWG